MRIHVNSFAKSILNRNQALQHYSDSVVRYNVNETDLLQISKLIGNFSLNDLDPQLMEQLQSCNIEQIGLIFAILGYIEDNSISLGLINAYALRLNISLLKRGFYDILDVLCNNQILIPNIQDGVQRYELNRDVFNSIRAIEG